MSLPKVLLAAEIADIGLCTGTVEELSTIADGESIRVGRYKLVGEGTIHTHFDYVEDGTVGL